MRIGFPLYKPIEYFTTVKIILIGKAKSLWDFKEEQAIY